MAHHAPKRRKTEHDAGSGAENGSDGEARSIPYSIQTATGRHAALQGESLPNADQQQPSLLKLQVNELLAEVELDYEEAFSGVDKALHRLKQLIENIKEMGPLPIAEATKLLHKRHNIVVPYPDPKPAKDSAYKVAYAKPENINVVGSYSLQTMIQSDDSYSVDLAVTMPASIFQDKDYLNYRYFYKKAYYLATIAGGLQNSETDKFSCKYEFLNGNFLQPIILVKVAKDLKATSDKTCDIRIMPVAPRATFPSKKLSPVHNAIRSRNPQDNEDGHQSPTRFYNSTLLSDCATTQYLTLLHQTSKGCPSFRQACILGRIWLRQRGFSSRIVDGGFGNFEWSVTLALLLQSDGGKLNRVLSPSYSSFQLFKAALQFLTTRDLVISPMLHQAPGIVVAKSDSPTLFDGKRSLNILYKMSPWSYSLLRQESSASMETLSDARYDQFEPTFIMKSSTTFLRFDTVMEMNVAAPSVNTSAIDHIDPTMAVCNKTYSIMKEGLTDRVKLIYPKGRDQMPWSFGLPSPDSSTGSILQVGVLFEPANIGRVIDHGPSAEDKTESLKFRKFWGDKSELRRFKDGSIQETLVWSSGSNQAILQEIVEYLGARHLGQGHSKIKFFGTDFDRLLPNIKNEPQLSSSLRESYRLFEKHISSLEDLPLQLRRLAAIDPQIRQTSTESAGFDAYHPMNTPANVVLQFEGSGRWPDDIIAIQRTKAAFLLKISNSLQEVVQGLFCRIGIENTDNSLMNCAFLDVVYSSGAVFRLRIHHDREQTLLERAIKSTSTNTFEREKAVTALYTYKRLFIQLPLHSDSITTQSTRFPLLSPTIRLLKKWFDTHLLTEHFNDELLELLACQVFLRPVPWQPPSSVMTGFLRILHFIAKWDWRTSPLIVDFSGGLSSSEISSMQTRLEAWRKIDPGMSRVVLFVASNHDHTGTSFTERGPSKVIAARMTSLARAACSLVKDKGIHLEASTLFAPNMRDYDFVMHLKSAFSKLNNSTKSSSQSKFKNLDLQADQDLGLIGYDPVRDFVKELEALYSSSIVFFYNNQKASVIAGLWNPQTSSRSFRVNMGYATKPDATDDSGTESLVSVDKQAILSELSRLGGDMVARIEVCKTSTSDIGGAKGSV